MKKSFAIVSIFGASFLMTFPVHCHNPGQESAPQKVIQDTARAVQFFSDEMDFTTNPHGVKSVLERKQNVVIVDVCAAKDYAEGHIPGAINLPFDEFEKFEGSEKEFPGLKKDGFNYVYCYGLLCNLSQKAAKKFASLGYPVKEIKGGFKAWKEHNNPVEK